MAVILVIHRYLAVAVGLLMSLWCLSGFVMMYQSFPALSNEQRVNGLQPLTWENCCQLADFAPHDDTPLGTFRIEMLLDEPVLRLGGRDPAVISLATGQSVQTLTEAQILQVAREFGAGNSLAGTPRSLGIVDIDQWTLQSARRNAPAWHIAFDDPARSEIYINGTTGEVFQATNRRERVLSWFGAIPHWLYPTVLRQNGPLWTEIVIWTSVLGTFLAATGLYVGINRLRRRRNDRKIRSPYTGWWYWHHISGLIFGLLVLTWVFSGLMTMNPWGVLSGGAASSGDYRAQISGNARWAELKQFLAAVSEPGTDLQQSGNLRQLTPAVFNSQLFLLGNTVDNQRIRLDSTGTLTPLRTEDIDTRVLALNVATLDAGLMYQEDSYYYGHKRNVELPVYRVIVDDAERTRLYINTHTGALRSVGSTGRWSRWIRTGLHDLDFPVLRLRPIWDVVVILLLLGVTMVCVTGTWMALKRVRHDFRMANRRIADRETLATQSGRNATDS